MKMPKIIRSKFEMGMDEPINTAVLRAAFRLIGVKYIPALDMFSAGTAWGIAIDDSHDVGDEDEPHYFIEVGEGNYTEHECKTYKVRYCDYQTTETDDGEKCIMVNPGEWKIRIWVSRYVAVDPDEFAREINNAYNSVMITELKDYMILTSELEPIDQQNPG